MTVRRELFVEGGYEVRFTRQTKNYGVFKCTLKSCRGEKRRLNNGEWTDVLCHNHAPHYGLVQKKAAIREVKAKLIRSIDDVTGPIPSNRVLIDELSGTIGAAGLRLIDREKTRKILQYVKRTRVTAFDRQLNGDSPAFDGVTTENGGIFMRYDSWDDDTVGGKDFPRMVIFASDFGLRQMENCTVLSCDGTQKCVSSSPFEQLYILAAKWGDTRFVPCVYVLMKKKDERSYIKMFNALQALMPSWKPRVVYTDMELAVKKAVLVAFPSPPMVQFCWFHVLKSWTERFTESGGDWSNSDHVNTFIKVKAMACLHPSAIPTIFRAILDGAPSGLEGFLAYINDNYVKDGSRFDRSCWSIFAPIMQNFPRSNSSVESLNRVINSACRFYMGELRKPRLSNVIQALRSLEGLRRGVTHDMVDEPLIVMPTDQSALDCYGKFCFRIRRALNIYSDINKQHFEAVQSLIHFTELFTS